MDIRLVMTVLGCLFDFDWFGWLNIYFPTGQWSQNIKLDFSSIFKRVITGKDRLHLLDSFRLLNEIMDMEEKWISVEIEKHLSIFQSEFK